MTRREYLTALNQYLVTMSESEKMKILKEYDEHFRKGFEAGKTEAQISASLGAPYDVANDFLEGRRPKVPTYPAQPRPQTAQSRSQTAQPRPQTRVSSDYIGADHRQDVDISRAHPQTGSSPAYAQTQPRQEIFEEPSYARPQQPAYSEPAYTRPQQPAYSEPTYAPPQQPAYSEPTYARPQQPAYSEPAYTRPQQPAYSEPTYARPQQPAYSEPTYARPQQPAYSAPAQSVSPSRNTQAYVDYDRAAEEKEAEPKPKKRESKYSLTGIIIVSVIGVLLVPTMGFAIYYLVRGLYELLRAFPGTGVALIAAGGSLSANSLWICLGLIFIGISFLALTGLLIMAIIEITKLFIKLFRYVLKECKKMIKEGSF